MPYRLSCCALLAIALLCALNPVRAQSDGDTVEAAKQAAQTWLALMDEGQYEATWEEAAGLLKSQMTAEQWAQRVRQAHSQLDSLQARTLTNARYTTSLPNAPEGEYVVARYQAQYGDQQAVELVTLMKDGDAWRVAGYFVKPTQQK